MFKADTILLEYFKHSSAETKLCVHHILFDIDYSKALLSCYTCDRECRLLRCGLNDHCTHILRLVCVLDVYWDACFSYRENSVLMKYACTHVRKLSQFLICYGSDRLWVVDNSRVAYQES